MPTRRPAGILHIDVDRFNAEGPGPPSRRALDRGLAWSEEVDTELLEAWAQLPMERLWSGAQEWAKAG